MIFSVDQESIVALCTPQGAGAIALIRISGDTALSVANKIASLFSGQQIVNVSSHTIHAGWVVDGASNKLDQVLFLVMHAPRTFTGQHVVEITCHNNPFIIDSIIEAAVKAGARHAQAGEFTKRAFLNGKIDLVQAESVRELIHASNQQTLRQSLAQLQGTFSAWVADLEKNLLKAIAFTEASFEFLDEDFDFSPQIIETIALVRVKINQAKQLFDQQKVTKEGIRIALIGSVNAGKSSLFNALLGKDRAIVTPIAGTTRDVIEAGVYKKGLYLTLVDTAGIRSTDDQIEQEGIRRSFQEAETADIVLLIVDGSRRAQFHEIEIYNSLLNMHVKKSIVVQTKVDVGQIFSFKQPDVLTAVASGQGITELKDRIDAKIAELFSGLQSPFLINKRHYNLLIGLEERLSALDAFISLHPTDYEIISHHLRDAVGLIGELTGKTVDEKALDAIFREFCVGK